jgi:hypothetical protein
VYRAGSLTVRFVYRAGETKALSGISSSEASVLMTTEPIWGRCTPSRPTYMHTEIERDREIQKTRVWGGWRGPGAEGREGGREGGKEGGKEGERDGGAHHH